MSPYAAQKIACELYAQTYTRAYGLPCVALRFFNVYGPRQDPKSEYAAAIPRFTTRLLAGQRPIVFGDGGRPATSSTCGRGPREPARRRFADGSRRDRSTWRAAKLLAGRPDRALQQAIGPRAAHLGIEHQAPRAGDLRESSADISKARALLGYEPRVPLADGPRRRGRFLPTSV